METNQPILTLKPGDERFELRVGEQLAFASFSLVNRTLFLAYCEVPDPLREQGVEDALMRGVFQYARAQKLDVIPICPLARAFVQREPEFHDVVREEHR